MSKIDAKGIDAGKLANILETAAKWGGERGALRTAVEIAFPDAPDQECTEKAIFGAVFPEKEDTFRHLSGGEDHRVYFPK